MAHETIKQLSLSGTKVMFSNPAMRDGMRLVLCRNSFERLFPDGFDLKIRSRPPPMPVAGSF